ncbi:MAG: hypothetical protein ABIS92_14955 [Polyangia bacterium]
MEIGRPSVFAVVQAPTSPVRGGAPVSLVAAAGAGDETFTAGPASGQTQRPLPPHGDPPPETGGGLTGVTEALYRLRTNWSPASHQGKSAIVALPRPDVIAAYHRDDVPQQASPAAVATADSVPNAVVPAHVDILT